ncbi:MAG: T9SS type A sorting domain-containing protein [Gemmatimonadota bacterium]|nr:MAG: T9SS type A sorting domain-containing protein [Gemmatimonadota bacterium]
MRTVFIVSSIIFVLLFCNTSHASEDHIAILRPGAFQNDVFPLPHSEKIQESKSKIQKEVSFSNGTLDTLTWKNDAGINPVIFGFLNPGDSMLVWLKPEMACSLIAIRFKPINFEGTVILDIWDASHYDPLIYSYDSTDARGWFGTYEPISDPSGWIPGNIIGHSPLGWSASDPEHHHWGPCSSNVTEEDADTWVEIPARSGLQGVVDLGSKPFFIGAAFYISQGYGFYAQYDWTTPYNLFKFYSACCGPDNEHSGWFLRSYFIWFEAIVKYYKNTPPTFSNLKIQNDTYAPGPFPISVTIQDKDSENETRAGVAFAQLVYKIHAVTRRVFMEESPEVGLFTGRLPELSPGDTVTYWIEATDFAGASSQSNRITFARLEPRYPEADILVIWDYADDPDLDTFFVDLFSNLDVRYDHELWNIPKHRGIDVSVIDWGWNTIYISGMGCRHTLPGREYAENPFIDWLEAGTADRPHNLLYVDQDYYCSHRKEYDCDWDEEHTEGETMYNYFGVAHAISDNHGTDDAGYDSVAIGRGDFAGIRVNFLPDAWDPTHPEYNLWPDWLVELTEDAEQIFEFKDSGFGAGVRLDRGYYKTAYLPWQDFFAVDSLENGDLIPRPGLIATIEKILEWFGTKTVVQHTESELSLPNQCHLFQNYPNPFNITTDIRYQLVESRCPSPISLKIYNILGQEVRTLFIAHQEPGMYTARWDGKDDLGRDVASGVYFYQFRVHDSIDSKHMVLLK